MPLYRQIDEHVRQLVATARLNPGDRLPSIRQLAHSLHLNQSTIARAYSELQKERVVASRRGAGTIVVAKCTDPYMFTVRQRCLSHVVNDAIMPSLSLGHTPEEVEAAFRVHLGRQREERLR